MDAKPKIIIICEIVLPVDAKVLAPRTSPPELLLELPDEEDELELELLSEELVPPVDGLGLGSGLGDGDGLGDGSGSPVLQETP